MKYKETAQAAIMFCDIVGSSGLYARLGNDKAKQLIDEALAIMSAVAEQLEGDVIKTIGDEAMMEFASAEQACEAAIAIGLKLKAKNISMRTGIDFGEVLYVKNDVFGDTVNDAAFLAKLAQPNQVVLTKESVEGLNPWLAHQCEAFDRVKLKGTSEKVLVYRLSWDVNTRDSLDATRVGQTAFHQETTMGAPTLTVEVNGQIKGLKATSDPLVIGRDPAFVDICLEDQKTSRRHCSIYFHRGKFVLEDHSTNGCYLQYSSNDELYLRRESVPLTGNGRISLGQSFQQAGLVITFTETRELA